MFIELTDQLRCPADHDESFLVLIPGAMRGREVDRGFLGCPVCQREYPIRDGVLDFGSGQSAIPAILPTAGVDPETLLAFLGLEGPGGYIGFIGDATRHAEGIGRLLPGVHLALVNPPDDLAPFPGGSILRSPRLPFKRRSLRGLVLGQPAAEDPDWRNAATGAVLPGLRAAGQGPVPEGPEFELLGSADGWWVGRAGK